jgi:hypothetical protein
MMYVKVSEKCHMSKIFEAFKLCISSQNSLHTVATTTSTLIDSMRGRPLEFWQAQAQDFAVSSSAGMDKEAIIDLITREGSERFTESYNTPAIFTTPNYRYFLDGVIIHGYHTPLSLHLQDNDRIDAFPEQCGD